MLPNIRGSPEHYMCLKPLQLTAIHLISTLFNYHESHNINNLRERRPTVYYYSIFKNQQRLLAPSLEPSLHSLHIIYFELGIILHIPLIVAPRNKALRVASPSCNIIPNPCSDACNPETCYADGGCCLVDVKTLRCLYSRASTHDLISGPVFEYEI